MSLRRGKSNAVIGSVNKNPIWVIIAVRSPARYIGCFKAGIVNQIGLRRCHGMPEAQIDAV